MSFVAESDPNFYTALKLLHSKAKSSTDQLKAMLDEALTAKQNSLSALRFSLHIKSVCCPSLRSPHSLFDLQEKKPSDTAPKPEKRVVDKVASISLHSRFVLTPLCSQVKQEPQEPIEIKKIRLLPPQPPVTSPPQSTETTPKIVKSVAPIEEMKPEVKQEEDSEATDIDEENVESERSQDFAFEGLACVVCKHIDVSANNQTVECQECHNLYHQECHKPAITDKDISDPRVVWYCSKCTKSMKKQSNKSKGNNKSPNGGTTTSAAFATTVNNARETAFQLMKAAAAAKAESVSSSNSSLMQPFKRVEPKASPSSNSLNNTTKPAIGLAGFAANLNRTNGNSLSTSTSSVASVSSPMPQTPSTPPSASNPLLGKTADKRLQQMKKKAAKGQEKKRFAPK
ncbi:Integrator complex subunit 12-like protein [Dinothrombium tinctorium]|uniref:Integrator complex subunit 12 n=1 Tax=Dinothrombium tinctorium TaxID=1965070 RepID=A0A3S3PPD3_9ACAR|nr:Integrator complex subunit 12-like protein [Dinothrombium tinctorium]RWS08482.1 Integrator complex subunit 12-like protein [Dinothrombium tinctorium]RWS13827.1 Integrator complex subunit 12-like protein [Dinothrombium tinctorium]